MEISINKMRVIIDELQVAELAYKKQVKACETVYYNYHSVNQDTADKRELKKILEELEEGYCSIKWYRETLMDIVKCYEGTEKNIIYGSSDISGNNSGLKKINIEPVKQILNNYNIKII